jgi:glycosyltransferase involved in cell wall biosynthesis
LITNEGLTDRIIFTGHRTDLREIIAVSDVVLSLTQKPESFGRTTLEALSMGIPVCGYAHGGVKEQLEVLLPEGEVDPGDVESVSNILSRWFDNPPAVVKEHDFLLSNMLDETLKLYEELVPIS